MKMKVDVTYEESLHLFRAKLMGSCCIDFENGDGTNECECPNTDCDNCRIAAAEYKVIESLKKQISKKPVQLQFNPNGFMTWRCPNCGDFHRSEFAIKFCSDCGQAIDWEV